MRKLLIATLLAIPVLVHAHPAVAAFEQAASELRSRACGLAFLKEGRRMARVVKAETSPPAPERMRGDSLAALTAAFMLMADGRLAGADAKAAQNLFYGVVPPGVTHPVPEPLLNSCASWLQFRAKQPDFPNSEDARWNAVAQAKATFDTE